MPNLQETNDIPEGSLMTIPTTDDTEIIALCCSKPKSIPELSSIMKVHRSQVGRRLKSLVSKQQLQIKYLDMKHPVYGIFNTEEKEALRLWQDR